MSIWTHLVVDVDYSPSDPGISNWFCDRTEFPWDELKAGDVLRYEDSGGLFGAITVVEKADDRLVLRYGDKTVSLDEDNSSVSLDKDGRNYTNFYLSVYLRYSQTKPDSK